jgi:hypothetical protein
MTRYPFWIGVVWLLAATLAYLHQFDRYAVAIFASLFSR